MKEDDMHNLRATRDRFVIDIRKNQREQRFQQSRKRLSAAPQGAYRKNICVVVDQRYREIILKLTNCLYQAANLQHYLAELNSEDLASRHEAIIAVRIIVSSDPSQSYIQQVIDQGAVPTILAYMNDSNYPQLQFQACWIVTNIAGGSNLQCQSVVDKGCINLFLSLLYEDRPFLNEQALWGIGNLAADCAQFRDDILIKGGHQCIIRLVQNTKTPSVYRQGVWALSNFCRGTPAPKYQIIKPIIPVICKGIASQQLVGDQIHDALWAIANSTEGKKSKVQRVLDVPNFVNKIIELCYTAEYEALVPALRIIGNISTGNQTQTQTLLRLDVLQLLEKLLLHPRKVVRRQSCWTISNISAGTKRQISQVLARPNLLQQVSLLFQQDEQSVKRQICYIFANMANLGSPHPVFTVVKQLNILECVMELIQTKNDISILEPALQALYDILFMAERVAQPNPLIKIMENTMGFYEKLEQLQHHECQEVYNTIVKIFQRFLHLEDDVVI